MMYGKTALVTGASRGIGRAVARKLASLGASVAVIYAGNVEAADETCRMCAELRTELGESAQDTASAARAYRCDVADFAAVKETVAAVKRDFGSIDVLVNNAGITRDGIAAMMKESDFDDVIATNLKGAFNMIRHCAPVFIRQRGGRIINVSSVAGLMGNAGQLNYSASKAGLIGMTKSAARELAPRGVTCNAIAPGFIETDMTRGFASDDPLVASIPLGRMGKPEEVASLAAFLASDEAGYITGEVFRIDGGLAM